jgi:hypothetical protein
MQASASGVFLGAALSILASNALLGRPLQTAPADRGRFVGPPKDLPKDQQIAAQRFIDSDPKLKARQEYEGLVMTIKLKASWWEKQRVSQRFAFASNMEIKKLRISKTQADDTRELESCTRKLIRSLTLSDLASAGKPPLERERAFASTERKKEELIRLSEAILMRVILSPQQADDLKVLCWSVSDYEALFDPELASRLGILPSQKEELKARRERALLAYRTLPPEATAADNALAEAAYNKYRDELEQARQQVWEVLTPHQMREWRAMARRVQEQP